MYFNHPSNFTLNSDIKVNLEELEKFCSKRWFN